MENFWNGFEKRAEDDKKKSVSTGQAALIGGLGGAGAGAAIPIKFHPRGNYGSNADMKAIKKLVRGGAMGTGAILGAGGLALANKVFNKKD